MSLQLSQTSYPPSSPGVVFQTSFLGAEVIEMEALLPNRLHPGWRWFLQRGTVADLMGLSVVSVSEK